MKLKPFHIFLSAAILIIGTAIFFKRHLSSAPALSPVVASAQKPELPQHTATVPAVTQKMITPEEREAAIVVEKDRLDSWAASSDSQSLSNILGDLISPAKEIRLAAIAAAKQCGNTNAIPVLRALAANAQDSDEAIALLDAADFLALPEIVWTQPVHPSSPVAR